MKPTTQIVETTIGPIEVRKLALNDYAELLKMLQELPKKFGAFIEGKSAEELKDTNTIYSVLPDLIGDAIPEFSRIIAFVSNKSPEEVQSLDLADAVDVVVAILELNDIQRVIESIKKISALTSGKSKTPPLIKKH